jgi:hypothetical protein
MGRGLGGMLRSRERRHVAACSIVGSRLLLAGTYRHPLKADPNEALAAFTAYYPPDQGGRTDGEGVA